MQLPQLTSGLSQYVKDDLTEHVRGWPAEACERQVGARQSMLLLCRESEMANSQFHFEDRRCYISFHSVVRYLNESGH